MQLNTNYKEIWQISYPIILGGIAQNIIIVINTIFLGRVGEVALGASAIGGLVYITFFMVGFGLGTGTQIIIARRAGESKNKEIGVVFDNSIYLTTIILLVIFVCIKYLSPLFLKLFLNSENVLTACQQYLDIRSWGIFFALYYVAFRSLFTGIASTKIITWTTVVLAVVNVIFDYCLIFGNFGFPEMGIEGAALASVIAEFFAFVFIMIYTINNSNIKKFNIFKFKRFDIGISKDIFSVSLPIMLQYLISLSSWLFFFIIIEQMGEHELAISNIIRSIYMLFMIPAWGFGSATNTIVSNLIGQGRSEEIFKTLNKIILLCFLCTTFLVLFSLFLPEQTISFYSKDKLIISDSVTCLYIIIVATILFSIVWIWFNALTGTGDTRMALLNEIITISIYLIYSYYVVVVLKQSIETAWCAEFVYLTTLGALSYWRLKSLRWKNIKI